MTLLRPKASRESPPGVSGSSAPASLDVGLAESPPFPPVVWELGVKKLGIVMTPFSHRYASAPLIFLWGLMGSFVAFCGMGILLASLENQPLLEVTMKPAQWIISELGMSRSISAEAIFLAQSWFVGFVSGAMFRLHGLHRQFS